MNAIITEIQNHQYKNRDAYKQDTKDFLHRIREKCKGNDYDRINSVCELLVKLYDDLMESINNAPESEEAINDDAIEGILAIADTCIEEQNEQRRNPNLDVKLEKDLCDILNGHENEELNDKDIAKARVNAFYCLCTKHRRLKDYKKFKKLVDDCKDIIGQDEIFKIMEAYYYIQETANDFNPMKALKLWKDNISATCKRLPAFTQIYTETVVLQCEMANEDISEEEKELLEESKKLIGKAIIKRPYAKFYSTRGRIYCCDKNYDEGINEVRKAIEIEDSKREDYFTRINEYQSLISRFQSIKDKKALKEEAKQIWEEMKKNTENFQQLMDKSKIDYISILGFFSAVMALIIGSTDIIKGQITMIDSLLLLMGFAGMIVISFGCLNMLLVRKEETRTNKYPEWLLLVIGGGMIVASLLMKVLYYYLKNIILI